MKIVYLSIEAPREGQASYVHVHEIINGLRRQNVEITLYEPSYTKKETSPNLVARVFYAILLQIQLWMNWRRGSILYVRGHYLAYPTALIAKLFGIPIIHEINGPYGDVFISHPDIKLFKNILISMQRWQYKVATGLIAVTPQLQSWANVEGKRQDCTFISNGANVDLFKPKLSKPSDAPDQYVIFFGGLHYWHGIDTMLDAVSKPSWPDHIQLLIIGKGLETAKIQQAAKKNKKISYLGNKPYKELPAYIANALAGLVTISSCASYLETYGVFPLKFFEILACSVPAVVTDLPGKGDFVKEHQCGIAFKMNDSTALAKQVCFLSENVEQAQNMGGRGYDIIHKKHSWQIKSDETLNFIHSIVKKKRG